MSDEWGNFSIWRDAERQASGVELTYEVIEGSCCIFMQWLRDGMNAINRIFRIETGEGFDEEGDAGKQLSSSHLFSLKTSPHIQTHARKNVYFNYDV